MAMTHSQVQRSVGLEDRVETDGRTDGHDRLLCLFPANAVGNWELLSRSVSDCRCDCVFSRKWLRRAVRISRARPSGIWTTPPTVACCAVASLTFCAGATTVEDAE